MRSYCEEHFSVASSWVQAEGSTTVGIAVKNLGWLALVAASVMLYNMCLNIIADMLVSQVSVVFLLLFKLYRWSWLAGQCRVLRVGLHPLDSWKQESGQQHKPYPWPLITLL